MQIDSHKKKRKRVESNQLPPDYEPGELPLFYSLNSIITKKMDPTRIELAIFACKANILPIKLRAVFCNYGGKWN